MSQPLLAALVVLIAAAAGLGYLRPWEARAPGSLPRLGEGDALGRRREGEALARPAPEPTFGPEALERPAPEPKFGSEALERPAPEPKFGPGAPDEGTYELSEVTQLPRPLNIPEVRRWMEYNYPPQLRDARVTGRVQLRFVISADGYVEAGSVQVTVSNPGFDPVAIRAVEQLRFSPALVGLRPVRVQAELPIQFQVTW